MTTASATMVRAPVAAARHVLTLERLGPWA